MATRKPSKPKTSDELKLEAENFRKRAADLERQAFVQDLHELIASTNILKDLKTIELKAGAVPIDAVFSAVAAAAGYKRIKVTLLPPAKRTPPDPNKPKKPRASTKRKVS